MLIRAVCALELTISFLSIFGSKTSATRVFSDKGIYHRIERDILMRIVDLKKEDQNEGVGQAEAKPSRGNPEDARETTLDSLHHPLPL
jgi:hypothetical protein